MAAQTVTTTASNPQINGQLNVDPVLDLSKDYDLAYKNLEKHDVSKLLTYKSDYLANVRTLLLEAADESKKKQNENEIEKNAVDEETKDVSNKGDSKSTDNGYELLKELTNPLYMNNIIEQYHQYFSNIKFTYLEQSTKEKFLRNVVNSKFITLKELEALKFNTLNSKKKLQEKKQQRDSLLKKVNVCLDENYTKYDKIRKLHQRAISTILKSKQMLDEISQLEKENNEYYESSANRFDNDGQVLENLHMVDDLSEVIQESKNDSLVVQEQGSEGDGDSSIISNFEDYLLLNSSKNLSSLVQKRKLTVENMHQAQEQNVKRIKLQTEELRAVEEEKQRFAKECENLKMKIIESRVKNENIMKKSKQNGEEKMLKNRENLSQWLTELLCLLKTLDFKKGKYSNTKEIYLIKLESQKNQKCVLQLAKDESSTYEILSISADDTEQVNADSQFEKFVNSKKGKRFKSLIEIIDNLTN